MNRPAMTVDPVYSDDATGQQIVDLQVRQTGNSAVGRDGMYRNWEDDYTADSQGRTIFDPKDGLDELAESPVVGFNEEEYTEALLASNPDIPKALDYALDNAPPDFVDRYNAAVDAGNLDVMHKMLEEMLREYHENNIPEPEVEDQPEEEPMSDEETTEFAAVLDDLVDQEPGGTAAAYDWLSASEAWASDPVMEAVCRATASFHDGSKSATELIDDLTSKFTPRELERVYKIINQ